MGLPPVPITLPPTNPIAGGLYDAATILDESPSRSFGGLDVYSPNIGGYGQWPTECPTPEDTEPKADVANPRRMFPATAVWADAKHSTIGWGEQDPIDRATNILRLKERIEVEKHLAATSLTKIAVTTVETVAAAVAAVEVALGEAGWVGVVHASREMLPYLRKFIVRQGTTMLTPGGHRWVFGGGYGELGHTLVATGPVIIRRGELTTSTEIDVRTNTRSAVVERIVAPAYDYPEFAVTVSTLTKEP